MTLQELYNVYLEHSSICTDSRTIIRGCLFFALHGNYFNGNKFIPEALEKGASYAIADEKIKTPHPKKIIYVDNSLHTLQQLAHLHRKKTGINILAITGSNGKTTTKELIAAVLGKQLNVHYTKGNLNNHIGVPLTLLEIQKTHEIAIVEMGANHPGEIELLCTISEPNMGLITNIGKAHIEGFGSLEGVIKAKTEMYRYLDKTNGVVFYHSGNPILEEEIKKYSFHTIPYGTKKNDFLQATLVESPLFATIKINNTNEIISSQLIGQYNFENILAATCLGKYMNIDIKTIKTAIEEYTPANNRSQYLKTKHNELILDLYNANPSSMEAAIHNFASIKHAQKLLILGDMLELGDKAIAEHKEIINLINQHNLSNVIFVGKLFNKIAHLQSDNHLFYTDTTQLKTVFSDIAPKNKLILIKGSRNTRLEEIVELL
jgi:UDP-N-acetylmuramoyl-tripeptide--D-alanyl-D-alanine ligase